MGLKLCLAFLVFLVAFLVYLPVAYNNSKFFTEPQFSSLKTGDTWRNWGRLHTCKPLSFRQPETEEEIQEILKEAHQNKQKVKVVGSGHSWMNITCGTNTHLLNFEKYSKILNINTEKKQVTLQAGSTYDIFSEELAKKGLRLPVWPVERFFTIGGVISTGSHAGGNYKALSGYIVSMRIITSTGKVVTASATENVDVFHAARVGVGLIGVISTVTMECRDNQIYEKRSMAYPTPSFFANAHEILFSSDQVICFVLSAVPESITCGHYIPAPTMKVEDIPSKYMALFIENTILSAVSNLGGDFPITKDFVGGVLRAALANKTDLVRIHEFMPFMLWIMWTSEMEYHVPVDKAIPCVQEVRRVLFENNGGHTWQGGIAMRPVKGDDIWLSPFYGQDSIAIEVHENERADGDRSVESLVMPVLQKCGGRPHWGKQFHYKSLQEIKDLYPKWDDFDRVRRSVDPEGMFLSQFWEEILPK